MRIKFGSLIRVSIALFLVFCLPRCATIGKTSPKYKGVDPKVQNLVNEYKSLAKIQGITFKNNVTIGFKNIKDKYTVGLCTYGNGWREIDIDEGYWEFTSDITHLVLVFHELGHCYCRRRHDFNHKDYPDVDEIIKLAKNKKIGGDGYYSDLCPKSLMYPMILEDDCVLAHYNDYITELFSGCQPY